MRHSLVTNQIELSLKEISPFTNGDLAFHQQHGHAVMAWSPLGGGDLMTGSGELADRLDVIAKRHEVDARGRNGILWRIPPRLRR